MYLSDCALTLVGDVMLTGQDKGEHIVSCLKSPLNEIDDDSVDQNMILQ